MQRLLQANKWQEQMLIQHLNRVEALFLQAAPKLQEPLPKGKG